MNDIEQLPRLFPEVTVTSIVTERPGVAQYSPIRRVHDVLDPIGINFAAGQRLSSFR